MDDIKVTPSNYQSSHKFGHDPLTEALHIASLESWQNETAGDVEGPAGWNALFHFDQPKPIVLPDSDATVFVPRGSYILTEDNQGFVYTARYDYASKESERDWENILELAYSAEEE